MFFGRAKAFLLFVLPHSFVMANIVPVAVVFLKEQKVSHLNGSHDLSDLCDLIVQCLTFFLHLFLCLRQLHQHPSHFDLHLAYCFFKLVYLLHLTLGKIIQECSHLPKPGLSPLIFSSIKWKFLENVALISSSPQDIPLDYGDTNLDDLVIGAIDAVLPFFAHRCEPIEQAIDDKVKLILMLLCRSLFHQFFDLFKGVNHLSAEGSSDLGYSDLYVLGRCEVILQYFCATVFQLLIGLCEFALKCFCLFLQDGDVHLLAIPALLGCCFVLYLLLGLCILSQGLNFRTLHLEVGLIAILEGRLLEIVGIFIFE